MSGDSMEVAIRVRPFIAREQTDRPHWTVHNNCIYQVDENKQKIADPYAFDHIFTDEKSNEDIYTNIVHPLVISSLAGFNSTVFMYGQTSSGKTYTMLGLDEKPGIMQLAIRNLFEKIDERTDRKFLIRVSYIEIYNEKVNDLLDIESTDLKIREDMAGNHFILAKEEVVSDSNQVLDIMKQGNKNRKIGCTDMNERSSRSHTIFRVVIESTSKENSTGNTHTVSHLNLVDLAGSERVAQTKAAGARLKEGVHINKSLSVLSLVIRQLSEQEKFVNFRDSKLTRLLQHALGGNAKTLVIATVTVASVEETASTLSFAQRAKRVKNKPIINEVITDQDKIKRYSKLSDQYKKRLEEELLKNNKLEQEKLCSSKIIDELQSKLSAIDFFKSSNTTRLSKIPQRRHTIGPSFEIEPKLELKKVIKLTPSVSSRVVKRQPLDDVLETIEEVEFDFPEELKPLEPFTPAKGVIQNKNVTVDNQQSFEDLKRENEFLTRRLKKLEAENRQQMSEGVTSTPPVQLRKRLQLLQNSYTELRGFTDEESAVAESDEVKELKDRLEKITQDYFDMQSLLTDTRRQISTFENQNEDLEKKIMDLTRDNKDKSFQLDLLQHGKKNLETMLNQIKVDQECHIEQVEAKYKLREEVFVSQINQLMENKGSDNQELLDTLRKELESTKTLLAQCETQITSLTEDLKEKDKIILEYDEKMFEGSKLEEGSEDAKTADVVRMSEKQLLTKHLEEKNEEVVRLTEQLQTKESEITEKANMEMNRLRMEMEVEEKKNLAAKIELEDELKRLRELEEAHNVEIINLKLEKEKLIHESTTNQIKESEILQNKLQMELELKTLIELGEKNKTELAELKNELEDKCKEMEVLKLEKEKLIQESTTNQTKESEIIEKANMELSKLKMEMEVEGNKHLTIKIQLEDEIRRLTELEEAHNIEITNLKLENEKLIQESTTNQIKESEMLQNKLQMELELNTLIELGEKNKTELAELKNELEDKCKEMEVLKLEKEKLIQESTTNQTKESEIIQKANMELSKLKMEMEVEGNKHLTIKIQLEDEIRRLTELEEAHNIEITNLKLENEKLIQESTTNQTEESEIIEKVNMELSKLKIEMEVEENKHLTTKIQLEDEIRRLTELEEAHNIELTKLKLENEKLIQESTTNQTKESEIIEKVNMELSKLKIEMEVEGNKHLTTKIQLEDEIRRLTELEEAHNIELTKLKLENEKLIQESTTNQTKESEIIEKVDMELNKLKMEMEVEENKHLTTKIQLEDEIRRLTELEEAHNIELTKLKLENEKLIQESTTNQTKESEIIEKANMELNKLKMEMEVEENKHLTAKIELENEIKRLTELEEAHNIELTNLKLENEKLIQESTTNQTKESEIIEKAYKELNKLKMDLEVEQNKNLTTKNRLEEEIKKLTQSEEKNKTELTELKLVINTNQVAKDDLEKEVRRLTNLNNNCNMELAELKLTTVEITNLRSEYEKLLNEKTENITAKNHLEEEVNRLAELNHKNLTELSKLKLQIEQLSCEKSEDLEKKNKENNNLKQQLEEKCIAYDLNNKLIAKLEEEKTSNKIQIEEFANKNKEIKEIYNKFVMDISNYLGDSIQTITETFNESENKTTESQWFNISHLITVQFFNIVQFIEDNINNNNSMQDLLKPSIRNLKKFTKMQSDICKLMEEFRSQLNELQQKQQEFVDEITSRKQEIQSLVKILEEKDLQISALNNKISEQELSSTKEQLKQHLEIVQQENNQLNNKIVSKNKELALRNEKILQLNKSGEEMKYRLEKKIKELTANLHAENEKNISLAEQLQETMLRKEDNKQAQNKFRLEKHLVQCLNDINKLEATISQLKNKHESEVFEMRAQFDKRVEELTGTVEELEEKLKNHDKENKEKTTSSQTGNIADLSPQMLRKLKRQSLQDKSRSIDSVTATESENSKEDYEQLKSKYLEQEQELKDLKQKEIEINEKLKKYIDDNAFLEDEVQGFISKTNDMEEWSKSQQNQIKELKMKLESYKPNETNLKQEYDDLKNKYLTKEMEFNNLQEKHTEINEKLKKYIEDNAFLEDEVQGFISKTNDMEEWSKSQQNQIKQLKMKLESYKPNESLDLANLKKKYDDLKNKYLTKEFEFNNLQEKHTEINEKLKKYIEDNAFLEDEVQGFISKTNDLEEWNKSQQNQIKELKLKLESNSNKTDADQINELQFVKTKYINLKTKYLNAENIFKEKLKALEQSLNFKNIEIKQLKKEIEAYASSKECEKCSFYQESAKTMETKTKKYQYKIIKLQDDIKGLTDQIALTKSKGIDQEVQVNFNEDYHALTEKYSKTKFIARLRRKENLTLRARLGLTEDEEID